MNILYGGAVNGICDTVIAEVGEQNPKLTVGYIQYFEFKYGNSDPFWMIQQTSLNLKHDKV